MSRPFLPAFALAAALGAAAACASSSSNPAGDGTPTVTPTPTASGTATGTPTATPSPTGTPATSCITELGAGDHSFPCDGLTYDVHVPAACAAGGCGLVLDVHGLTMDAAMEDANTGMRALGDAHGFVIVQPNANPAPPLSSWNANTDYDKVYAFVLEARDAFACDPAKIHMTGFSQGGLMTFAFLCRHADLFASVAAGAAGGIGCTFSGADMPSREIPVLQMHGTQDALISYSQVGIPQRDDMLSGWNMGAGTVIAGDGSYTRTRYVNANGTVVEFISHDYTSPPAVLHGHCFPGSTDPGGAPGQLFSFACTGPNAFDWGAEAMAFFEAH